MGTELIEVKVTVYDVGSNASSEDDHEFWHKPFEDTTEFIPDSREKDLLKDLGDEPGSHHIGFDLERFTEDRFDFKIQNAALDFTIIGESTSPWSGTIDAERANVGISELLGQHFGDFVSYALKLREQEDVAHKKSMAWTFHKKVLGEQDGKIRIIRFITAWKDTSGWSHTDCGDEYDLSVELLGVLDMSKLVLTEIPDSIV